MGELPLSLSDVLTAINAELGQDINEAMNNFRDNPDLWVAIITGARDRAFSAGADIRGFRRGAKSLQIVNEFAWTKSGNCL